jgi:hypothetical protein
MSCRPVSQHTVWRVVNRSFQNEKEWDNVTEAELDAMWMRWEEMTEEESDVYRQMRMAFNRKLWKELQKKKDEPDRSQVLLSQLAAGNTDPGVIKQVAELLEGDGASQSETLPAAAPATGGQRRRKAKKAAITPVNQQPPREVQHATNSAAAEIPATSTAGEQMEVATTDDDEGEFQLVTGKKRRFSTSSNGSAGRLVQQSAPRREKIRPLVLDGVAKEVASNPLELRKVLAPVGADVQRTLLTKQGKVLVFAKSDESRTKLLAADAVMGSKLRQPIERSSRQNNFVLIVGVSPAVNVKQIEEELHLPCTRLMSAQFGGAPTWKVKVRCATSDTKAVMLRDGVNIGFAHFKVIDYRMQPAVLQCYKCQSFGHIAAACKSTTRCRQCGGEHSNDSCEASEAKCANCGGPHAASSRECEQFKRAETSAVTEKLSYADKAKKGGDITDCVRMACCMASALTKIVNDRIKVRVAAAEICKDVAACVSQFYKVRLHHATIYQLGFVNKAPSLVAEST